MRLIPALCFIASVLPCTLLAQDEMLSAEDQAYLAWSSEFLSSLDPQTGEILLPGSMARLHVSDDFYYLDPQDAERVLSEAWGNPPGTGALGMLLPAGQTPLDEDSWAVVISFEEDGYVSDEDAYNIDYDELLEEMQADTRSESGEREAAGYGSIDLVGWAARPYYDKSRHQLYWAKELEFDHDPNHTLNYSIRSLGRKGVLEMNFVAGMNQLDQINGSLDSVLAMVNFVDGHRYEDFDPSYDEVAAYGLGALVAGKLAAKTGAIAGFLLLLKKFWWLALVAIGGVFRAITGKKD
ncbi:DUF2167 domain-containing protein [Corallincola spongiicola]|uniref:DUF2167 domain-containing protein n=1 Tax=Corallincola spongiicola TaxID=2520508 RepID=A0ABY1WQX2_9GAMM|nr:DUF2167 domain-containing protein [Corallincola spongiicola]TAA47045.1 DUF2167 domain-containing protein [Corallincola spongiicola]